MKQQNGLFQVEYIDNIKFVGNLFKKDWNKIANKQIRSLIFIYGNKTIKMENYEAYDLTLEILGFFNKKRQIRNIKLIGRKNTSSDCIIYDFVTMEVVKKELPKYSEYGNLISSTWKEGIKNKSGKCYFG